jgi:hypothetical protein
MELHERPAGDSCSVPLSEELTPDEVRGLAPPDYFDPVIEAYKQDVDRTLLIENLRRTVPERLANFQKFMDSLEELRGAALPPKMREELLRNP